MNTDKKELFIHLWKKYFNNSELPIAFYYANDNKGIAIAEHPEGHRCLIAQLNRVRKGESLSFNSDSIGCIGGKRYLGYSETFRPRFEQFLSHGNENEICERYKSSPELVSELLEKIPPIPAEGDYIIFKRWDQLTEDDKPIAVFFFATADVIAGLFTLASYDSAEQDAVISPFGAGCTSIIYHPWREERQGTGRAVIGMFDPSARKCIKKDIISFAVPISKFMKMINQMEESFLITDTWSKIQSRIE